MRAPSRPLTHGEIALARPVFGDAIDYARVRIVRGRWWPFQPRTVAMAPNGNMYFPDGPLWSADFAAESLHLQGLFVHELTHVWQAQKAGRWYLILMRHPFCRYRYRIVPGRPFHRYGIEQQAEMVRHVFLARRGAAPAAAPPPAILDALLPFGPDRTRSGSEIA